MTDLADHSDGDEGESDIWYDFKTAVSAARALTRTKQYAQLLCDKAVPSMLCQALTTTHASPPQVMADICGCLNNIASFEGWIPPPKASEGCISL